MCDGRVTRRAVSYISFAQHWKGPASSTAWTVRRAKYDANSEARTSTEARHESSRGTEVRGEAAGPIVGTRTTGSSVKRVTAQSTTSPLRECTCERCRVLTYLPTSKLFRVASRIQFALHVDSLNSPLEYTVMFPCPRELEMRFVLTGALQVKPLPNVGPVQLLFAGRG